MMWMDESHRCWLIHTTQVHRRLAKPPVTMPRLPRCYVRATFWFIIGIILGWRLCSIRDTHDQASANSDHEGWVSRTTLFVAVLSSPGGAELRTAARNTWLRLGAGKPVAHRFFVGTKGLPGTQIQSLEQESRNHNDDIVLLRNHEDSYDTLAAKMLAIFDWTATVYKFDFFLKLDDDSLARVDSICLELDKFAKFPNLYWGFFAGNAPVFRTGKWAEKDWFLSDRYLPYARGGGYVLSYTLVLYLSANSHHLQHYKSEDVAVGVWLSGLKVKRVHDPRFDTEYRSRGCSNSYLVTHKQTARMMFDKHKSLKENGVLCPSQVRWRRSYVYNWKVPPSQCCVRNDSRIP